jgi:hypothetical protein
MGQPRIYVSRTGEIFRGDPEQEGCLVHWDGNWHGVGEGPNEVEEEMARFLLAHISS